jgi:hypothetical protein
MLATKLEMRPIMAHCHAGLARLRRRRGRDQEGQEHFIAARTMYGDMGMTYWLTKLTAESR